MVDKKRIVKHGSIIVKPSKLISSTRITKIESKKKQKSSKSSLGSSGPPTSSISSKNLKAYKWMGRHMNMPVLAGYVFEFNKQQVEAQK